jgi:uncharacterized membrane protein
MTSLILGVGLGFYAYESNLALIPMKWQTDNQVAKEMKKEASNSQSTPSQRPPKSGWDKIGDFFKSNPVVKEKMQKFWNKTGVDRYVEHIDKYAQAYDRMGVRGKFKDKMDRFMREGVKPIPQKWTTRENLPYFIAGLILVILSFIGKLLLYLQVIDVNRFIKHRKWAPKKISQQTIQWNEMIQGFTTIALSVMAGMYSTPFMDWLAGQEAISYPYPRLGLIIIMMCILLKFLVYFQLVNFNRKLKR